MKKSWRAKLTFVTLANIPKFELADGWIKLTSTTRRPIAVSDQRRDSRVGIVRILDETTAERRKLPQCHTIASAGMTALTGT